MAEPETGPVGGFVFPMRTRAWLRLLLLLVILYAIWFAVVLLGEQQAWGSDPAKWAGLSTTEWAWIGLILYGLSAIYLLALLAQREVPAQTYTVPDGPAQAAEAPQFLQVGNEPPREAESPTSQTGSPPPQG